jgi:hypothetical protein
MNKEQYAERLDSSAWREFADKCKQLAGNRCIMCGSTARLNCHHMRYKRMGTPQEWLDIAVVCERCHQAFHDATPFMSNKPASRMELLNELAIAVSKKGRNTDHYDQSSSEDIAEWIATPIIVGGLINPISSSKTKAPSRPTRLQGMHYPKPKAKVEPAKKKPKWKPPVQNFTPIQARAFLRHGNSPVFDTVQFKDAYGIKDEPANWQRLLAKALRGKFKKPLTFSQKRR